MPSARRRRAVEEAIIRLDFATAQARADQAEGEERTRLRDLVEAGRMEAVARAEQLAGRIQAMARADHYEGLLDLAEDPETEPLLNLIPPEINRGARLHLDGALLRQKRYQAAADRHMKNATEFLALFDPKAAFNEIKKVELRWISDAQRVELHALVKQTDQAVTEQIELEGRTAEVIREHLGENPDSVPVSSSRPGGGSKNPGRGMGCLGSALMAWAVLIVGLALPL
ncbi:MAG: hypothetical protein F4X21_07715 [Acidimicrobiia bacterium]|nr:hypothetical protein [Acidimicrobiia bacterium]